MRSPGKGSMSATTQVKVLSPVILHVAMGQGFHFLEAKIGACAMGERVSDVPGSESVAGVRTVYSGTWENRSVAERASREAEEATREHVAAVVGPTRSRGVNRVIPVASRRIGTLEGVGGLVQRDWSCHAIH